MHDALLAWQEARQTAFARAAFGRPARPAALVNGRQQLLTALRDPAAYKSMDVRGDEVRRFVIARRATDDFRNEIVRALPFLVPPRELDAELAALKRLARPGTRKLVVFAGPEERALRKALRARGFAPASVELAGRTDEGLAYLDRRLARAPLPSSARFRRMRKVDVDAVLRLERRAHTAEPTSLVELDTRESVRSMRAFYERMATSPRGHVLLLEKDARLVGLVGLARAKDEPDAAQINSIAVDPAWQGQGLGLHLYREALRQFHAWRRPVYLGGTTTGKVLRLAEKLGRREVDAAWSLRL